MEKIMSLKMECFGYNKSLFRDYPLNVNQDQCNLVLAGGKCRPVAYWINRLKGNTLVQEGKLIDRYKIKC